MMNRFAVIAVATLALANAQHFKCPNDRYGLYADDIQCDKFYECNDGVAETKLCPDGLVFDETIRKENKCDQPFNVDCGDRVETQPAKGNEKCPRLNGFFPHLDPSNCHTFYNCIDGTANEINCSQGLHFDEYTGTCVWIKDSTRTNCRSATKDDDPFQCPLEETKRVDSKGQTVVHPKYPHESDCQSFYVCLNGREKRLLGCEAGKVYNIEDEICDDPENVEGCQDWYAESDAPTKKSRRK